MAESYQRKTLLGGEVRPWPPQLEMRVPFEPTTFPRGSHFYVGFILMIYREVSPGAKLMVLGQNPVELESGGQSNFCRSSEKKVDILIRDFS